SLVIVLIWFIISTLLNLPNILDYKFKGLSGVMRFIRQYGALVISAVIFLLTFYNSFSKKENYSIFLTIRKVFFISFCFVSVYAFLEIGYVKFGITQIKPVIELFNHLPFIDVYLDIKNQRISSLTYEPPALSSYLLTIAGWMFSYILTGRGLKKYVPALLVLVFALFSDSRSAIFIIFVQALIFLFYLIKERKYQHIFIRIGMVSLFGILIIGVFKGQEITHYIVDKATSFGVKDDVHSTSNKTRFGIQYALGQVFKENPVSGVGFGQQTYASLPHYPEWATKDNWEFRLMYLNQDHPNFPPGFNLYLRLLAETGLIGFLLFCSFLCLIIFTCIKLIKQKNENQIIGMVILISMIGFMINWVQIDTFRVFGFWISLALLLYITKNKFIFKSS
ncbi:MAG: O-antigen ligase family protein, partial [Psychroflexus sp.]|nr:O-antigen ligase family protein [Psychroflexus sp.]